MTHNNSRRGKVMAAALEWPERSWGAAFEWRQKHPRQSIGIVSILIMTALTSILTAGVTLRHMPPRVILVTLGILAGVLLIPIEPSKYQSLYKRHFGWLPVTAGLVTYPLWWWYSYQLKIPPASQFFEISAQVLPVLLLAAIIDVRRSASLRGYQLILPTIAVVLGEVAALNALAFGEERKGHYLHATATDFAIVATSLTSTFIALVLAVLADLQENENNNAKSGIQPNERAETDDRISSNPTLPKP